MKKVKMKKVVKCLEFNSAPKESELDMLLSIGDELVLSSSKNGNSDAKFIGKLVLTVDREIDQSISVDKE